MQLAATTGISNSNIIDLMLPAPLSWLQFAGCGCGFGFGYGSLLLLAGSNFPTVTNLRNIRVAYSAKTLDLDIENCKSAQADKHCSIGFPAGITETFECI